MPSYLRIAINAFLILLIGLNGYRAYEKNWNYGDPIDFRGLYLGATAIQNNQEIYNDSIGGVNWNKLKTNEHFESSTDFGDIYVSLMLYPPNALILTYPLSLLKWKRARIIWWFILSVCFLVILAFIYYVNRDWTLVLLILAFKGSFFALSLGQPMLFVFACLIGALYFQRTHAIIAGIFLGFALIKFNLVVPFGLYFLLQKRIKMIITSGIVVLLLLLPALYLYPDILSAYLAKGSAYYAFIYQPHERNIYTFSNSELTMMLDYYWDKPISFWKTFNIVAQLSGYGLVTVLYLKKNIGPIMLLTGLLIVSFLFSYHLTYDALLFIIPIALFHKNSSMYWTSIILLAIYSLPINAVFGSVEIVKFHYPILLCTALIIFIFACKSNAKPID